MRRNELILAISLLALVSGTSLAASTSGKVIPRKSRVGNSVRSTLWMWFKHLKKGLTESTNERYYRRGRITAVAAVRGARQKSFDPDRPDWKGGRAERKAAQRVREKSEFEAAVDLILSGKMDEGVAALNRFETKNPQSSFLQDVHEARLKVARLRKTDKEDKAKSEEESQLLP